MINYLFDAGLAIIIVGLPGLAIIIVEHPPGCPPESWTWPENQFKPMGGLDAVLLCVLAFLEVVSARSLLRQGIKKTEQGLNLTPGSGGS